MGQSNRRIVAAFDFDGTLTRGDSLFPFLWFYEKRGRFFLRLWRSLPTLVLYALKLMNNNQAKERVLRIFLHGDSEAGLLRAGEAFATGRLNSLLRPRAMERLHWHQAQGHECILISASMDIYLHPWAAAVDFNHVICSHLEMVDGLATGALRGGNCFGEEKARRLQDYLGDDDYILYAYGDSRGDKELLAMADYGYYRTIPSNS